MRILLCFLILNLLVHADEVVKPTNFLEVDLKSFEFSRKKTGEQGRLVAKEVHLSRADLTFNFKNKDKIFDAKIFSDTNSIKFKTDFFDFDFKLKEDSTFFEIMDLNIEDTQGVVNPGFFIADGKSFHIGFEDLSLKLKSFYAHCTMNDDEFDMATSAGIEAGCLNQVIASASANTKHIDLELNVPFDDGDNFNLKAKVDSLTLMDAESVEIKASETLINLMDFVVKTQDMKLTCKKDKSLYVFNADKIMKDCENTVSLETERIVVIDDVDKTRFFIKPNMFAVGNERVSLDAKAFQFVDEEKNVTMFDFFVNCSKPFESDVYDLHSLIAGCVNRGTISIGDIFDKKSRRLYKEYDKVLSGEVDPLEALDYVKHTRITRGPRAGRVRKKKVVDYEQLASSVQVAIHNKEVYIKLVGYKNLPLIGEITNNVTIKGFLTHEPERKQLKFTITSADIPATFWRKDDREFVSELFAEMMVGDTVTWDNDSTFTFHL